MYVKILVTLDGSELSEIALPYAEQLAVRLDSEILLLMITEPAEAQDYRHHQLYLQKIIKNMKSRTQQYREETGSNEIRVNSLIRVGYPAEEIVGYADKGDMELIVMATHGRSGIGRWALGSVADKVVRATRQPVALIRTGSNHPEAGEGIMNKALVPLDGSTESERVLTYISELALKLGTELTLLQVVTENSHARADAEVYLKKVCSQLSGRGISAGYEIRTGAAAEVIIDLADEMNADIVAMSTRGRSGVSRWTLGSVAEKVLLGGDTPLLLVRSL